MELSVSRKKAREQAFILAFEKLFIEDSLDEIIELLQEAQSDDKLMASIDDFAIDCVKGMLENVIDIDVIIEANLKKWNKNRISKVSLTILRLSVYQLKFMKDEFKAQDPAGVIINEAVRLTKVYSTEKDASFVNGVLGSIARA